jgi:hypothetical protein
MLPTHEGFDFAAFFGGIGSHGHADARRCGFRDKVTGTLQYKNPGLVPAQLTLG